MKWKIKLCSNFMDGKKFNWNSLFCGVKILAMPSKFININGYLGAHNYSILIRNVCVCLDL